MVTDGIILVKGYHQTYLTVSMSSPSNPKLQGSYCTDCPTHGLPPLLGTGSVHVRIRCLTPAHASARHSVQVPHTLQLPCCTPNISHASLPSHPTLTSTAKERKQHFIQTQVKIATITIDKINSKKQATDDKENRK